MNKRKICWIKRFKKWHKWPALIISFFAVVFAVSGVVMNHRSTFAPFEVSRDYLPEKYRFNNWNLGALKGGLKLSNDSVLLYGKMGVYLTDSLFKGFENDNKGFDKGADNRSVSSVVEYDGFIYAATLQGLYRRKVCNDSWEKVSLSLSKQRIVDVGLKEDTLLVLSRDYLLKTTCGTQFQKYLLPPPEGYKKEVSSFRFLWTLHSGEMFGLAGKLFVDLLGVVVVLLSITGVLHFFFPTIIRKFYLGNVRIKQVKKQNLRSHNLFGYVFGAFLFVNTLAGIFLRPPLLIPIAGTHLPIISYTHLDDGNPWQDKLRAIRWNESMNTYVISTSDGFYMSGELLDSLMPMPSQPPVSVMGCNVFESVSDDTYLIGSFSGLYSWNIRSGFVYDMMKQEPVSAGIRSGKPISDYMISGLVRFDNQQIWVVDYNVGMYSLFQKQAVPKMEGIVCTMPMSLWNLCLELHTGRIFEPLLGPFYILFIPLAGICMLIVLISGFFLWLWVYRKTNASTKN